VEAKAALKLIQLPKPLESQILHLILMPTEACNFRCVYCYEDFKLKRMEPWVVSGVKNLLTRRAPGLRRLTFSWFGGEPLLAPDVIEEIMEHAEGLATANRDLRVRGEMTTNAYLLGPATFRRMLRVGVTDYQISFDGPREWHDRKRVLAGGRGTFARIWSNLRAMSRSDGGFEVSVRVHVDRENVAAIPNFIREYKVAFGADPRFKIFIRGLSRLGGPNDANLRVFGRAEGDRVVAGLRDLARSEGLALADATAGAPICYAARENSLLVRADGRLNKCTVALAHPNNQVGRILEDGTIATRRDLLAGWTRGLTSNDPEELSCPMIGYAEGGGRLPARPGVPLRLSARS
jgi:uncharacterized protein